MPRSLDEQPQCGPTDHVAPRGALLASQLPAKVGSSGLVHSDDLLRGQRTLDIQHNGTVYRLQTTRLGKLILTK
jgi:hemin uptake protein HemP